MASIYNDIRAALETKLAATSNLPAIAYQNVPFSPTTGTPFLKTQFVPTLRRPAVMGLNPQQRYQGVFSVTVFTPEGNGPGSAEGYVGTIINAFEAATSIYYDNVNDALLTEDEAFIVLESGGRTLLDNVTYVSIEYAERQLALMDSPWFYVPVDIGWYIYE